MENYILAAILVLGLLASLGWRVSLSDDETTRNMENSKAAFEKADRELKQIYASMAEYDRLIKERDAAYLAGDKELYYSKVREASECYKRGRELFEN